MHIRVMVVLLAAFATRAPAEDAPSYVVVDGPQVAKYWKSAGKTERLDLPRSVVRTRTEGCVAVGYSIEADGKPANLVVVRAGYADHVDKQVADEVEQRTVAYFAGRRYEAATTNPEHKAVYTYGYTSFTPFASPTAKAVVDQRSDFVSAHCVIPDFPAAVARGDLLRKPVSP